MTIKLERGDKALMAWPLVDELFFAASLTYGVYSVVGEVQNNQFPQAADGVLCNQNHSLFITGYFN